ncbi:MAG: hypothetical protein DRI97_07290 [Bacteroidetes bacterium]|nr:MAG: hypothetical protein DRI97_07290 [Bacteroidota bacterium]
MAILNISGTINSSFGTSGVLVNAAQAAGDAVFTIDLRPDHPIIIVQDNLDYGVLGWNINDAVATIILIGPEGEIYRNEDFGDPDIVPATSRYLNKTITLPLDPLTDYANILKGNYTLKIAWYNSTLDEYYNFLKTYQYILDPATIANTTTSGPYTGVLTSTDTTEYGPNVHQIIREHRIQYPTQLAVPPPDVVSSNAQVQVTPIYTNEWAILINSFVEYRNPDLLRIYWEGEGEFTHCVYGGCIGAMYDAIDTMLTYYREAMACNLNNQEAYQKRLVIVNTAWHLLNEAYWSGDAEEADEQAYIIQEQVEYTGAGICGGSTSELVVPCPPWTGGGVGGSYTFSNALTEGGGNVVWGGTITQPTTINMVGNEVLFSGTDAGNTVSQSISASGGIVQKSGNGTTEGSVSVIPSGVELKVIDSITPANNKIYNVTVDGLVEASDYSSGYTGLSLVNKDYVDGLTGNITFGTAQYQIPYTNAGLSDFDYSAGFTYDGSKLTLANAVYLDQYGRDILLGSDFTDHLSRTDNTLKDGALVFPHYTNSEENIIGIYVASLPVNNLLQIGGGDTRYNAATTIQFYIGSSTTTVAGTLIANILSTGFHVDTIGELTAAAGVTINDEVYLPTIGGTGTNTSIIYYNKTTGELTYGDTTAFVDLPDTPSTYTGFAGYFLAVNPGADAVEFVAAAFVPVTGGTFTGQVTIATSTDRPLIIKQIGAGSAPGTPEGGINLIAFQDNDGDEQGHIGIDASGNVVLKSFVTGAGILIDSDLEVNGDLIITGVVDGVDIAAWKTEYDTKSSNWDDAYSWGDHAGLYQLLDADLTAIAALGFASVSFLKKTAIDTWVLDTEIYATKDYVDSLALTYIYPPDVLDVVTSDGYTGTVSDVQDLDGDVIQVEEESGDPGFEIRFEYINVTDFNNVFLYLYYHGGATHDVLIQLYNYDTLGWDTIGSFTDQTAFTIIDIPIALDTDYMNGSNESTLRIYHNGAGNTSHYIEVDYAVLRLLPQLGGGGGITDHGGLTGLADDDHPQYALADGTRCVFYSNYGAKQSSVDAGALGEFSVDDDYLYVCVVAGSAGSAVWKQTALLQSP